MADRRLTDCDQSERVLVVDDEPAARQVMVRALARTGRLEAVAADSTEAARRALARKGPFALVILDILMPGESGLVLLDELAPAAPQTVVILLTAVRELATAVKGLKRGAYDYIVKPVSVEGLQSAVDRALRRRQDELAALHYRQQWEATVQKRLTMLERTRSALLRAMCLMAEFRKAEAPAHLDRVGIYSLLIAEQLAGDPAYADLVDEEFLRDLGECAPLHDLGKAALPDKVLLKPGKLTPEETATMQQHTTVGRETCLYVKARVAPAEDGFLDMAADVVGAHHERWDGEGYPEGLKGPAIPLSARIVGLADFYDACRSPAVYRSEPLPHDEVVAMIEAEAGKRFDPGVVAAFCRCAGAMKAIRKPSPAHAPDLPAPYRRHQAPSQTGDPPTR